MRRPFPRRLRFGPRQSFATKPARNFMNVSQSHSRSQQGSALLGYLFVALITMATIAAIAGLVVQNMNYSSRRQDMVNALQFAQGGAAICVSDVQQAFTNASGIFL